MDNAPRYTTWQICFRIVLGICLLHPLAAQAQEPASAPADEVTKAKPVIFTTKEDHANMMAQLGITKLRRGRSGNAESLNAANYDEAKANPYPKLPAVLTAKGGEKVETAEQWVKVRRPEIVTLLEQEVYGRIPGNVPTVKWEVRVPSPSS